ncbi:MAG: ACT domain-containing protein [Oscillospiraceae bacterium]|nr:ACT domain-containing protein [Oscillospiraceae bacterium]
MTIKQLSIFVENRPGRLAEITDLLGQEKIDIRAVCVSDTREFGILRLIVDNPEAAAEKLKAHGCTCSLCDVLVLKLDDNPGGLAYPMHALAEVGISVEYMYAFVSKSTDAAYVIFRVQDNEHAMEVLAEKGVPMASQEEIARL